MGICAIFAVLFTISQTSAPPPRVATDPKGTAIAGRDANAQENQKPPPATSPVVPQQVYSPTFNCAPAKESDKDAWDKAVVLADFLLVAVGIAGIYYAARTLGKLREQAEAAKDAAESSLLNAKALISAERAWLVLEERITGDHTFVFFIKNVGKSAAKIISIRNRLPFVVEVDSLPPTPEYRAEDEQLVSPVLLPPGEERFIGDFSFEDFMSKNLPWASAVKFGGGKSLYIYGRVEYSTMPEPHGDNKSELWETRYCRWYIPMERAMFIESRCPAEYNGYK